MNINENSENDKAVMYDENLKPVLQVFEKEWIEKPTTTTITGKKSRKRGVGYIENPAKRADSRYTRRKGAINQLTTTTLLTRDHCYIEFHNTHNANVMKFSTSAELMKEKLKEKKHPVVNNFFLSTPSPSSTIQKPQQTTQLQQQQPELIYQQQQPTEQQIHQQQPFEQQLTPPLSSSQPCTSNVATPSNNQLLTPTKTYTELLNCEDVDLVLKELTPTVTKKKNQIDKNSCKICNDEYDLNEWIGCDIKNCDHWVHQLCLGLQSKKKDEPFENIKFFCPAHRLAKLKRVKKKLIK